MTQQTVEFDLANILEETNRKIDRLIEGQIKLEGKIDTLEVKLEEKTKALQNGQDELKNEVKEVKSDIKGRVSIQTYWFLLLISVLVGIIGKFAFFPNP